MLDATMKPNSRRTARWRERKARGAFVVAVEVDNDVVARLLADGYLQGRTKGGNTHVRKADVPTAVREMLMDYAAKRASRMHRR